jgi:VanZ family protein
VWMMRFQRGSHQQGVWIRAVAIPGAVLAAGEAAQCWLPGRTPEVTDLALVAAGAFLLWLADTPQPELRHRNRNRLLTRAAQ